MVFLTKQQIVEGMKHTETMPLPMYDNAEVAVRELTDLEYNQYIASSRDMGMFDVVSAVKGRDVSNQEDTTKVKTSMKKVEEARFNAKVDLVYKVLDNEDNPDKFTKQDIQKLKAGAVDLIVDFALSISGLDAPADLEDEIEEFRKEE